ncbi:hypothetical protein CSC82_19790 [Rhodobacteraceae bacterium 4F10]|nr:hypothetical protein CSC82_19790 [Rhodobacteraceae bacterium 4F10]
MSWLIILHAALWDAGCRAYECGQAGYRLVAIQLLLYTYQPSANRALTQVRDTEIKWGCLAQKRKETDLGGPCVIDVLPA